MRAFACACWVLTCVASAVAGWDGAYIEGRTAQGKCFYAPNEKMTFELTLHGHDLPAGDWQIRWKRSGDDGHVAEGRSPVPKEGPLLVETSLSKPGFVRLEAFVTDSHGQDVRAPSNPHGKVFFDGGAGVEPENIPAPPEPEGFDAWWHRHLGALPAVPMNPRLKEYPSGRDDVKLYEFSLDCPRGMTSTGWMAIPTASGKYPMRVKFFGYNESWSLRATAVRKPEELSAKELRVWISPHGFEHAREPDYYAKLRKEVSAGYEGHAWSPVENARPDSSYFAKMAWRIFRGLGYAKRRPEWDGRTLTVTGGSQGALQSVWAAAFDPAVTDVDVSIIWNCDAWGKAKEGRLAGDWMLPWAEGLRWFDAVTHAKRIPARCRVNVSYAGLGDYISPPSGLAAFYNALNCSKSIRWVQGGEHGNAPMWKNWQTQTFSGPITRSVRRGFAFRSPAKMELLPPGAVKPRGWLRDWCVSARNGYVSKMDGIDQAFPRAWNRDFHPRGKYLDWGDPNKGAWCTEGGAYWFEGLVKLAWELDDAELKSYATKRLEPLLERMNPKAIGFVYWMDRTAPAQMAEIEKANHGFIVGASGRTTRALLAYYEATGDGRAIQALKWCLDDPRFYFFGNPITLPAAACDTWRYCGDKKLAAAVDNFFATKPYPERWPAMRYGLPCNPKSIHLRERRDSDPNANWEWRLQHGVLCYESMLSWVRGANWTGDRTYLENVLSWLDFQEKYTRQIHGVTVADEQYGAAGPDRGTETCTVAGDILLYSMLAGVTGEGRFADHIERSVFNAGAVCASRDYMKHVYFQSPNRTTGKGKFHAGPAGGGGLYKTKHWPLCCTAALTRIIPSFVQGMWMRPAEGGLAATFYAPNVLETEVDGISVRIETATTYPFGETVELAVSPSCERLFPLHLRVPGWCTAPEFSVNGEKQPLEAKNGYQRICRTWKSGDRVHAYFPMRPRVEICVDRNDGERRYCGFSYGPLCMVQGIPEKDENTPTDEWRRSCTVNPKTALANSAITRLPMPSTWNWQLDAPLKLRIAASDATSLELVPYGCARLRVALFPVEE